MHNQIRLFCFSALHLSELAVVIIVVVVILTRLGGISPVDIIQICDTPLHLNRDCVSYVQTESFHISPASEQCKHSRQTCSSVELQNENATHETQNCVHNVQCKLNIHSVSLLYTGKSHFPLNICEETRWRMIHWCVSQNSTNKTSCCHVARHRDNRSAYHCDHPAHCVVDENRSV